ncbi:MAG: hypothetical protein AAFN50_04865 [Pseudomonadota bacterium]
MEISEISTSIQSKSLLTAQHSGGLVKPHDCDSCDDKPITPERQAVPQISRGAALQVLRQELRMSLKAQFHAEFKASQPNYAANKESMAPSEVADEALGVAEKVVDQAPTRAAKSIIQFRLKVQESIQVASKTVQSDADQVELDDVAAKIDDGVAKLEEKAAATRESSTSALNVDMRTRQRSTIKIRTQEGDIVKLSLRQGSNLSASSSETIDGESSSKTTEIDFSSRSRMFVKVRGDLNEAEMGAIQSVLADAQKMADDFYGGDIGAAFNSASGFEFDTEQLSRVKMRFRMHQETNVAYSQVTNTVATPNVAVAASKPSVPPPEVISQPLPVVETAAPVAPAVEVTPPSDVVPAEAPAVIPDNAMQGFFELVGNFMRSVSEGFVESSGSTTIRYQYSESFKLSLLQSVINTVAPDDAGEASNAAVELINHIAEGDDD